MWESMRTCEVTGTGGDKWRWTGAAAPTTDSHHYLMDGRCLHSIWIIIPPRAALIRNAQLHDPIIDQQNICAINLQVKFLLFNASSDKWITFEEHAGDQQRRRRRQHVYAHPARDIAIQRGHYNGITQMHRAGAEMARAGAPLRPALLQI